MWIVDPLCVCTIWECEEGQEVVEIDREAKGPVRMLWALGRVGLIRESAHTADEVKECTAERDKNPHLERPECAAYRAQLKIRLPGYPTLRLQPTFSHVSTASAQSQAPPSPSLSSCRTFPRPTSRQHGPPQQGRH